MIREEAQKEKLEAERSELKLKVVENCRELMRRTVKINMVNKYNR